VLDAATYAGSCLADPPRICGVQLIAFTYGHALILERIKSPFVCAQAADPMRGDLAMALLICSRPAAEAWRLLRSWRGRWWIRRLGKRFHVGNFDRSLESCLRFSAWLCASYKLPELWEGSGKARALKSPYIQCLKVWAVTEMHMSPEKVMDTPIHELMWDSICWREMRGKADPISDDERELLAILRAAAQAKAQESAEAKA